MPLSTASETWITWFRSTHHLLSDYLSSTIRLPIRLSTTIRLPFDYLSSTFQLLFDHQPNKLSILLHRHQNKPKHTKTYQQLSFKCCCPKLWRVQISWRSLPIFHLFELGLQARTTNARSLPPCFSFIWAGFTGKHHQARSTACWHQHCCISTSTDLIAKIIINTMVKGLPRQTSC